MDGGVLDMDAGYSGTCYNQVRRRKKGATRPLRDESWMPSGRAISAGFRVRATWRRCWKVASRENKPPHLPCWVKARVAREGPECVAEWQSGSVRWQCVWPQISRGRTHIRCVHANACAR
jgi:hypothetical protein